MAGPADVAEPAEELVASLLSGASRQQLLVSSLEAELRVESGKQTWFMFWRLIINQLRLN